MTLNADKTITIIIEDNDLQKIANKVFTDISMSEFSPILLSVINLDIIVLHIVDFIIKEFKSIKKPLLEGIIYNATVSFNSTRYIISISKNSKLNGITYAYKEII